MWRARCHRRGELTAPAFAARRGLVRHDGSRGTSSRSCNRTRVVVRVSEELSLATSVRTHLGGALRAADAGSRVRLGGWVQRQRAMGGIVFLDLRDRAGVVQVSFDPKFADPAAIRMAGDVGRESVVLIEGEVVARPENGRNADLATGEIEVKASSMRIVGPADTPAIPVSLGKGESLPSEELRLRHRYLDLRRPELQ